MVSKRIMILITMIGLCARQDRIYRYCTRYAQAAAIGTKVVSMVKQTPNA